MNPYERPPITNRKEETSPQSTVLLSHDQEYNAK